MERKMERGMKGNRFYIFHWLLHSQELQPDHRSFITVFLPIFIFHHSFQSFVPLFLLPFFSCLLLPLLVPLLWLTITHYQPFLSSSPSSVSFFILFLPIQRIVSDQETNHESPQNRTRSVANQGRSSSESESDDLDCFWNKERKGKRQSSWSSSSAF